MVIKASGLDEICGFKKQQPYSANNLPPFVTKLFHKLYDLNVFSPDWYKYVIIPLFEKVTIQTQTITLSLFLLSMVRKGGLLLLFLALLNKRDYVDNCNFGKFFSSFFSFSFSFLFW